jgi:hypothetical protein
MADSRLLDVVSVIDLHERLGFATPLEYPQGSMNKSFADWKMEVDDAPILRYIYRHVRPRRHLEFGTWEGTGACYCLDECDAHVWTINLPDGERIDGSRSITRRRTRSPREPYPLQSEATCRSIRLMRERSSGTATGAPDTHTA